MGQSQLSLNGKRLSTNQGRVVEHAGEKDVINGTRCCIMQGWGGAHMAIRKGEGRTRALGRKQGSYSAGRAGTVMGGRKVCWLPFVTVIRHHDQNWLVAGGMYVLSWALQAQQWEFKKCTGDLVQNFFFSFFETKSCYVAQVDAEFTTWQSIWISMRE